MLPYKFNLSEEPFGVTPDPRFLYMGQQHREAMASLAYGTESNRGFLALVAKPGMGKTTLLYHYLDWLRGKARTAYVFRTDCDARELIRHILLDLGVDTSSNDLPTMHDSLNKLLIEEMNRGRRFVLVIDEAQNLNEQTLESIRLLSNFETPWKKLMQIVIAGQPGLAEKLARPSMTQLRQRVSMVMRLEPLDHKETSDYIDHRLWVAGCEDARLFTPGARAAIAEYSQGIPRNINNLCFNAMSLAGALKRTAIDRQIVQDVLADLDIESLFKKNVDSSQQVISAPARTAAAEQKSQLSVWPKWFPQIVGTGVAVLALCGAVGGSKQEIPRTDQAGQKIGAFASPPQISVTVGLEDPLAQQKHKGATALEGEQSHEIGDTDRNSASQTDYLNDAINSFDVRPRVHTADSLKKPPETLLRLIDPASNSRSTEAESNE